MLSAGKLYTYANVLIQIYFIIRYFEYNSRIQELIKTFLRSFLNIKNYFNIMSSIVLFI